MSPEVRLEAWKGMAESNNLSLEERATNYETFRHIERVRNLINLVVKDLLDRAERHDQSKLAPPEVSLFTEYTPKLAACAYGSPEYEEFRRAMGPALAHHYAKNRHHPEHFPDVDGEEVARLRRLLREAVVHCPDGSDLTKYVDEQLRVAKAQVGNMTLLDLIEMFVDWKAASERHHDGNIRKSIEVNAERFGLSNQLRRILENTAALFDG